MDRKTTIAIDAMGGDFAPAEVVKGTILACQQDKEIEAVLVGPLPLLEKELKGYNPNLPIRCLHTDEFLKEGEPPALTLRQKRKASIAMATGLVKNGEASGVISAGPTGGAVASAVTLLGTAAGLERPAIGGPILGFAPETVIIDSGSNIDCKPYHLLDFALIGTVYADKVLGVNNPTVALLSVGAEEGKGNSLVKESFPLFKKSGLNFIGNVEGNDIVSGKANVIICDGFVGNILLKFCEALGVRIGQWLEERLTDENKASKIHEELVALTNITEVIGGGLLLGVNGVVMIMHGRSQAEHFARAILSTKKVINSGFISALNAELEKRQEGRNDQGRNNNQA